MFFRDYYFSSGNSRVNRLIALFRCIVGLMRQIYHVAGTGICDGSPSTCSSSKLPQKLVGKYLPNTIDCDLPVWSNSVDPDQMLQTVASDQGVHCMPLNKF